MLFSFANLAIFFQVTAELKAFRQESCNQGEIHNKNCRNTATLGFFTNFKFQLRQNQVE